MLNLKKYKFSTKILIVISFLALMSNSSYTQNNENWFSYRDEVSNLIGYKNSKGKVMILPKFMGITNAPIFQNIIAVMEEQEEEYKSYYLTKSGKKIGVDSLFIVDNGADCENEGFIRFKDKKTDKIGMFDKNGNIVIPAVYNALSKTHNGVVSALKNSKKAYWDDHKESGCNHFSWEGGEKLLININNQILIENFDYEDRLDFYTMTIQNTPSTDSSKINFKGVNNKYYTFNSFGKEFSNWLNKKLIPNLTLKLLQESSMDSLVYWEPSTNDWLTLQKNELLKSNFKLIEKRLKNTQLNSSKHFITINGLNPFIYNRKKYNSYYNNCGESKEDQFPVLDLIINHEINSELIQDHFEFLKTNEGYRLIGFTIWKPM